jgi:antitoxin component HigA of HigAB toxin-antitoxin module
MPLNGDVKTFPLSAIVQMIHDESKTGMLTVINPRRRCSIYFKGGIIIFVRGNTDAELRLGALLLANNLINEDRLQDMLAVAKAMEKRLGTVLLERNHVTGEQLASILNLQFKEVVTSTLSWDDAKFTYTDGLDGYVEDIKVALDPVRLVAEARKRGEFKGLIPNDQVVFQINPRVDTTKSVHAARDLRVLLLLDGRRSVAHIIKETGYSRLAVYRSLAKLHAQNAIIRKGADKQSTRAATLELTPVTALYWSMLQLIMADLAEELGERKAATSLTSSLTQSAYYENFLKAFSMDQDLAANINRMQALIRQQSRPLSQQDVINGFNQTVIGLLGEEYRFLGFKATRNTVQRIRATLDKVPANQRPLAQAISKFLEHYQNEDYLKGAKKAATAEVPAVTGTAEQKAQPSKADGTSGNAIINFYNDMFQLVIHDLQNVVGAKALGLFQGLIQGSKHSDTLRGLFDVKQTAATAPLRLKEKIITGELKLSTQDLVQAFQQVLGGLLIEERRLLGPKATDSTLSRMAEKVSASHQQFKPLLEKLSAALRSKPG